MSTRMKIELKLHDGKALHHTLKLDGMDVGSVASSASLLVRGHEPPALFLSLNVLDPMTIDGFADVFLDEDTEAVLVRLGWTPPADHEE